MWILTHYKLLRIVFALGKKVSPNTDKAVVELAHQHGLPILIGALTPTDVANTIEYNIKVFPAGHMGVDYFKASTSPYSKAQLTTGFEEDASGAAVSSDFCQVVDNEQELSELTKLVKSYISKLPK